MATLSGPSNVLGKSLAETNLFGSSSTTLPTEKTDCVSVSIARAEHYRSAADLWKQLSNQGLPNRGLDYDEIDTLLDRTGTYYASSRYDSLPNGQTAFEALYSDWIKPSTPDMFIFGILFYSRRNTCGHCVNFVNLGHEKGMKFFDFQNLKWSENFTYAEGSDCSEDVSKAETIFIAWDRDRTSFERWEDDHDPYRCKRAQDLLADGYNPAGYLVSDLNTSHFHSIYRYSAKEIISPLFFRPLLALPRRDGDLLRDLGYLTARGRTQIGNLPVHYVMEEQKETVYSTKSVRLWDLQSDDQQRAIQKQFAVRDFDETGKIVKALVRPKPDSSNIYRTTLNPTHLRLQNMKVPDILHHYYTEALVRGILD